MKIEHYSMLISLNFYLYNGAEQLFSVFIQWTFLEDHTYEHLK